MDHALDTNGQRTWELTRLYEPPDFVKRATHEQLVGPEGLPPAVFADPAGRRFRCHTAPATWMSALFFHTQKEAMAPAEAAAVEARLDRAAHFHGIAGIVAGLKEAVAANSRSAEDGLADDDFLLAYETPAGAERHYPLRNAGEVKQAALYLRRHANEFALRDRQPMAERLLQKAAAFEAGLHPDEEHWLAVQAGRGFTSAKAAAAALRRRVERLAVRGSETALQTAERLEKVAAALEAEPAKAHDAEAMRKLACLVDDLDRSERIKGLPPAESEFFRFTAKEAADFSAAHVQTATGYLYEAREMQKLALADLGAVIDPDFAEACSAGGLAVDPVKAARMVPTLPRPDAERFDRLCAHYGIRPAYQQPAPASDPATLEALAREHERATHGR